MPFLNPSCLLPKIVQAHNDVDGLASAWNIALKRGIVVHLHHLVAGIKHQAGEEPAGTDKGIAFHIAQMALLHDVPGRPVRPQVFRKINGGQRKE